jgi:hypothetical protein
MALDYVKKNLKLELPVTLDNDEIAELAHERGRVEADLAEKEQEYSDVKKDWNEKLETKRRTIAQLGIDIRSGKQNRPVLCDEVFRNGTIQTIRQDTGAVVGTRPASMQEAQRHLPSVEGGTAKPNILEEASAAQKASGVEEDDEGDVTVPDSPAPKKGKKRGKRS